MNQIDEHHKHEETHAFEADRVIFQVRDQMDDPESFNRRLVGALKAFLGPNDSDLPQIESNKKSSDRPWRSMVSVPTLDDLSFIEFPPPMQVQGSQRFSLIPLRLEGHKKNDLDPDDVLEVLNDAYTELGDGFINPDWNEGEDAQGSKFKPFDLINGIGLMSISPNWLGGSMPHNQPTGGPGSLPASLAAGTQRRFEIRDLEVLDSLSRFRRPGAKIVIFDTARDLKEFPVPVRDTFTTNPPMEVYPYPNPNYPNPLPEFEALIPYWVPQNEHYDKSDHGTFIASIIRKITPGAQIYLYEVLNRYGDGSFVTVSHGLSEALKRHAQDATKLVFNCSFGMVHELPKHKSPQVLWESIYPKIYLDKLIQKLIFMALRDAFAQVISHPNITVVAAAGNEANKVNQKGEVVEPGRPSAWYPAAFDKVLSVAALPKHYPRDTTRPGNKCSPASYSNNAQSLGKDQAYSFATFGGERRNKPGNPYAPADGVVGVYIGKIPKQNSDGSFSQDGPDNQTYVGQWAGTSFATPIISALVAAQENELNDLVGGSYPHDTEPLLTIDDENVIPVHQV